MLEHCSFITAMDVHYDSEQRIVKVNNRLVRFTPTEYKLVHLLLTNQVVCDTTLFNALSLQAANEEDTKRLIKNIDRIRCKIMGHGLYLYRVNGYGYMFLPEENKKAVEAMISEKSGNSRIAALLAYHGLNS